MIFKQIFPQIVHVFVGVMLTVSASAQTGASPKYDFNYRVSDERIAVFDDGKVTRIQLPEGMTIPIVMSQEPAGDVLLDLKKDSPYLSIQGTYSKLVMRWSGKREVVASYNGTIEVERLGRPAAFGMAKPLRTYGAVNEPIEFEKTQMAVITNEKAPSIPEAEQVKKTNVPANPMQEASSLSVVSKESSVVTVSANSTTALPSQPPKNTAFSILQNQRLMPTLKEWLANQSIELVWAATSSTSGRVRDVVLETDFESSSSNVSEVLAEILSPFDFEAEIAQNNGVIKRVTVRNARYGL